VVEALINDTPAGKQLAGSFGIIDAPSDLPRIEPSVPMSSRSRWPWWLGIAGAAALLVTMLALLLR